MARIRGVLIRIALLAGWALAANASYSFTKFESPHTRSILYSIRHAPGNRVDQAAEKVSWDKGNTLRQGGRAGRLRESPARKDRGDAELIEEVYRPGRLAYRGGCSSCGWLTPCEGGRCARLLQAAWSIQPRTGANTLTFGHLIHHR